MTKAASPLHASAKFPSLVSVAGRLKKEDALIAVYGRQEFLIAAEAGGHVFSSITLENTLKS